MADNQIYFPYINPVAFMDVDRANLDAHFTRHFEDYTMSERLYAWQTPADYVQPWQTTDIINLQFEASFDPITVELINNETGEVEISLPAIVGLANIYYPNTFSFEVEMSLAAVPTGTYYLKVTAGTGDDQRIYVSKFKQWISAEPFEVPTVLIGYSHSRFHEDVIFETGIEFQVRIPGHFGLLTPGRQDERYRDQQLNPTVLSSRSFRQWPLVLGDEFGLPDEMVDLVNRIFGCDTIVIDNKSFAAVDGSSFEFRDAQDYPKRGLTINVEEGINRGSKLFGVDIDPNKKLVYGIMVSRKVFGDTSNQGSSNTVPILTVE